MSRWRLIGYVCIFFIALCSVADAQGEAGGYVATGTIPANGYPVGDAELSFWQLPVWIKLIYVCVLVAALAAAGKLMPLVIGKIDDLLKNENRQSILSYIYANPGATIAQISDAQAMERTTVRYHLYKLESEGKIVFRKMGKFSRLFRNSGSYSDGEQRVIAHMRNRNSKSILLLIREQPGISNQELTERLGIEKSAVHWHLEKFISDGLVQYSYDGKYKRFIVCDNVAITLEKYGEQVLA